MDLWIRTQDKRQLLKVNDGLYIANGFNDTDDTFIGIKNVGHVGRYAEEERALEVLDEIQEFMTYDKEDYEGIEKVSYQVCGVYKSDDIMTYEMPEE